MNVQSIQLISNNICFGPKPEPEEEVEQRLTINKSAEYGSPHSNISIWNMAILDHGASKWG